MRRLLKLLILLGGVAWAVAVVLQADMPGAWRSFADSTSVGQRGCLLLFLVPSALAYWLDTRGWIASFGSNRPPVSFGRLFGVRLAGEAVNQATPLLSVGGEPVKVLLVAAPGIRGEDCAASVIAARWMLALTQALYAALAVLLAPPSWRSVTGLPAGVAAVPALSLLGVLLLLPLSHLVVGRRVRQRLQQCRLFQKHATSLGVLARALGFWRHHPGRFAMASLCFLAGWAVVAGEFWLVARVLGPPISWSMALALEGLMNLVTMATFFIPGNLGSQEAGLLYLGRLAGLGTPFGAIMVLLRRSREILWIAAGLGCLALLGSRNRPR